MSSPSQKRVLVLDGESTAGVAVLQSLGRHGERCWLGSARRRFAGASRYAARETIYPDPLRHRADFLAFIAALHRLHSFDCIIPCTESTLVPLHEVRETSPEVAVAVAMPPAAALDTVLDKERLRRIAERAGIPTPVSRFLDRGARLDGDALSSLTYPCVVKPARSKIWIDDWGSGLHVRLVHDAADLRRSLRPLLGVTGVQLQEWVPGHGIGIELLADQGRIQSVFAHERLHELPLSGGGSTYRRSITAPPALLDASEKLVAALAWTGVAMVEFRWDPASGRHWLMEVNGRFWGSLPLAVHAGVDFPVQLLAQRTGATPSTRRRRRTVVYARSFSGDLQWSKAVIRSRTTAHATGLPRISTALPEWLRVFTGREVWDGASWRDPGPILVEVSSTLFGELRGALRALRHRWRDRSVRRQAARVLATLPATPRILVLCLGNICRSPYAAARLAEHGLDVRSAGFSEAGRDTPALMRGVAMSRGVNLATHRSARVTNQAIDSADLILIMEESNGAALRRSAPRSARKTCWLGAFGAGAAAIADPYERSVQETDAILDQIDSASARLAKALGAGAHAGAASIPR